MASRRRPFFDARVFWALTVLLCVLEAGLLHLTYSRYQVQERLTEQLSLTHQAVAIIWSLDGASAEPDGVAGTEGYRKALWIDSVFFALNSGAPVNTLGNSPRALAPVTSIQARKELTEILDHWARHRSLHELSAGSQLARNELHLVSPALGRLIQILTTERNAASDSVQILFASALLLGLLGLTGIGTLLLRQSRRFQRSGQLMRSMMNQIGAGVCILGSSERIADANRAACRMLGRPRKNLRGKRLNEILREEDGLWIGQRPDGMPLAIERIPGTIAGEKGPLSIITLLDVTARHLTAECLQHLAHHDPLTGLPNRSFLEGHMKKELARCKEQGLNLGVAVLDLDGFKPINDTYGHAVGDELLVQIAQRLGTALRIHDLIVRTGGDEFVGIFPDVGNRDSLSFLGERLLGVFNHPFLVMGYTLTMSGSLGLAVAPEDGESQDSLLRAADMAMYQAKQAGKRRVQLTALPGGNQAA